MRFLISDFPYKNTKSAEKLFCRFSRWIKADFFGLKIDELNRAMVMMNRVVMMKMQLAAEKFHRFNI
jgi:hypothetical protein